MTELSQYEKDRWSPLLTSIGEVVGPELALKLVDHMGGIRLWMPVRAREDHRCALLIGFEPWQRLCAALGGKEIVIPTGRFRDLKKVAVIELAAQNLGHAEIARRARTTERYVRKILNDEGAGRAPVRKPQITDVRRSRPRRAVVREDKNLKLDFGGGK